jgi:hypothetical protein
LREMIATHARLVRQTQENKNQLAIPMTWKQPCYQ